MQGGDYKGRAARLLEVKETEGTLYVRSVPVNWAGGEDVEDSGWKSGSPCGIGWRV